MNITQEYIGVSKTLVRIEVSKADYKDKVDKVLKEYSINANIPGFRKGRIPMSLLNKKYGKTVITEEVSKLVSDSMDRFIKDKKLDLIAEPVIKQKSNLNCNLDGFIFEAELVLCPEFELDLNFKGLTRYKIILEDYMVEYKLTKIRQEKGNYIAQKSIEKNSNISVRLNILKHDSVIEECEIQFNLSDIKSKSNREKFIGKKVGNVLRISAKDLFENIIKLFYYELKYFNLAEEENLDLEFTIKSINYIELAELNQELLDSHTKSQENISSTQQIKDLIKTEVQEELNRIEDIDLCLRVTKYLIENTNFNLPKDFPEEKIISIENEEEFQGKYSYVDTIIRKSLIEKKIIDKYDLHPSYQEIKYIVKYFIYNSMNKRGDSDLDDKRIDDIAEKMLLKDSTLDTIRDYLINSRIIKLYKENPNINIENVSIDDFFRNKKIV